VTLASRFRALADRIDRFRGRPLEPLPLLAGSPESEAVAQIFALCDDGLWRNVVASWCDPSLSMFCDAKTGEVHRLGVAVRHVAGGKIDNWVARQLVRGCWVHADVLVSPATPWNHVGEVGV